MWGGATGKTVARNCREIPLTIGVVGAVLLPVWVAIGAIAAVVTDCTIDGEGRRGHLDVGGAAGARVVHRFFIPIPEDCAVVDGWLR